LALRWMDTHGEKLYNGYGSTEVGFAALADPADLRAAPGCVGRAPLGVVTKIMGADGREKPAGETGHVCVGSPMLIDGYVGGGNKSRLGGLMNTGDLGHYDAGGRLHIDGREDDMIISGGENVYPQQVEDILARLPGVREVAVIGVPDAEFGQRLKAVIVPASGTLEESALRAYLKATAARYMMPRDFVFMDDLPRNASGKVLRRKLAAMA
jgi:fatty-acyl-CoA synthase